MDQGVQSTTGFPLELNEEGCYFLCLLEAVRPTVDRDTIIALYHTFVDLEFMRKDCFLARPDLIMKYLTGARWDVAIGTKPAGDVVVACNMNPKGFKHFTLVKPHVWDPLNPARPAATTYSVNSYRNFTRLEKSDGTR